MSEMKKGCFMAYKATFVRPVKTYGKKFKCFNPKCSHESTQKAVYGYTAVPCCDREECMLIAIKWVVDAVDLVEPFEYYTPWGEPCFVA